jgi:hypothetical protein
MGRFRIVVLCLLGLCAFAAVAATSASAELPELGRCVKVATPATGEFTRSNCIGVSKKHTGEFEWVPGPGAAAGFKALTSIVKIETAGGKIGCTDAQLTGEYTGTKTVKVTKLVIQGCEDVGPMFPCYSNPLEKGTIESENPLVGELGVIPGGTETNPWVGLDLKSENSLMPFVSFQCGEGGGTLLISLEGSVIGRLTKTNKMASEFGITYKQSEGKQLFTAFTGGEEDVLTEITRPIGGTTKEEQARLVTTMGITNGEALEVKAKV